MSRIKEALQQSLQRALRECDFDDTVIFTIERPPQPQFGDFSTNAAMIVASRAKQKPREVAQKLVEALIANDGIFQKVEIAGPGFINFYLSPTWMHDVVRTILSDETYGTNSLGAGTKVQVEFVSANPNGPIHVGHGRGGVIGDVLANLLAVCGYDVQREFYINDAAMSGQMQRFARSLDARYQSLFGAEVTVPEDGYKGEYLIDLAEQLRGERGDQFLQMAAEERIAEFMRIGQQLMLEWQRKTLEEFGIRFDHWFSEQSLNASGQIPAVLEQLQKVGATYKAEGAVWLKSTQYGDDKDRVVVRSNGASTYLASDIAYHIDKFERGFDRVIDIWGPDHHGYIARTKAGLQWLGYDASKLDIFIYQIVKLLRSGQEVKMSKRAGDIITLNEVMEEVGKDAARFFFLMRSHDSQLDFDLDLAKKQSADNPVYYVHYGHARICSILREADGRGAATGEEVSYELLAHPQEVALMRKLSDLPEEIEIAATNFEPHRMTRYATELAATFHGFYTDCRVLGDDAALTAARLALVKATRIVLARVLDLLGVSAPERM